MSNEQMAHVGSVPRFAGGYATYKREQDDIIKHLAEHGVMIEHEVHFEQVLPAEENTTGLVDNFAGESHYYNWHIDNPPLTGVSYSFAETLGDIIDALKQKGGTPVVQDVTRLDALERQVAQHNQTLSAIVGRLDQMSANMLEIGKTLDKRLIAIEQNQKALLDLIADRLKPNE